MTASSERLKPVNMFLKAVGSCEGGAVEELCAYLPGPSRRLEVVEGQPGYRRLSIWAGHPTKWTRPDSSELRACKIEWCCQQMAVMPERTSHSSPRAPVWRQ